MTLTTKACPILLRGSHHPKTLVFRHPLTGIQLVKGSIKVGESADAAALRELYEEAGICCARVTQRLGIWDSGLSGQIWPLHVCEAAKNLPERWQQLTLDDCGHRFAFFWHPLHQDPSEDWHMLFCLALKEIRRRLEESAANSRLSKQ